MERELPATPRLADGLELVVGPGDSLQLRGSNPPVRLTGRMPHRLLPLLDGAHSLDAITAALPEWAPPEILAAIGLLADRGLISEGALAPSSPGSRAQAAFYATASTGPVDRGEQTRQALQDARIHLCGWGALVDELARGLRQCGAERLTVEAWLPPSGILAAESTGTVLPFPTPDQFGERVPPASLTDLVLLAMPRPAPALLAAANAVSLRQGVLLLPVVIHQGEAVIGPTVLPGRTACYECFKHRLKTHASFPDDEDAYDAHLDREAAGVTLPEWPPFTAAVAALAAMEAVRLVTRFTQPVTLGQVLFLDALTGTQQTSRIWKLPQCPACARVRHGEGGGESCGE
jgi:bacteriocin biosynthesis cyclodehydratase domain-containing protein